MSKKFMISLLTLGILALGIFGSCSKKEGSTPNANVPKPPIPGQQISGESLKGMTEAAKTVAVAKVNGHTIGMDRLLAAMNAFAPKYVKPGQKHTPEIDEAVRKEALDNLIFEELALQEAKRQGIKVKPGTVDGAIGQIKAQVGSEKAYKEYLDSRGLTEADLRKQIERNEMVQLILEKEVFKKIDETKPDEKSIQDIYAKEKNTFVMPDHIIAKEVFFPRGNDEKAAKKKAEEILAKIKQNGGKFDNLAKDPLYIVRDLVVTRDGSPDAYALVSPLAVGEVSNVIMAPDGFHIVKVLKKNPAHQMTFAEAREIIESQMTETAAEKRTKQWEEGLRKKAKIEIFDKQGKDVLPVY